MFEILNKQILASDIKRIDVHAPAIAKKIHPGQFVSICPQEGDERIPLTVIEFNVNKGTLTFIFQEKGAATTKLGELAIGEEIFSILGPLGIPAKIERLGTVVCIATGIGAAQILPICRAFKQAGNKVIGIIGAKTKKALMLEAQMRLSCNQFYISTNDGSYERRGLATDILKTLMGQQKVELVYAIGSHDMMQEACLLTQTKNIPTRVCLNPVMVDCMGMCGSCRIKVGGKMVLACIDGPEFDGHQVDFKDFGIRIKAYEELATWHSQKSQLNPPRSERRILPKFLADILKS